MGTDPLADAEEWLDRVLDPNEDNEEQDEEESEEEEDG
jgi:hypothetical protein